jgi:folate-dependent tRNA-U54 methylase TrmFO/GidA
MNANWGLLPDPEDAPKDRDLRRQLKLQRARDAMERFAQALML